METIDIKTPDPVVNKHIPYVVILVKIAEEWAQTHSNNLPSAREEKKEFKVSLLFVTQQTVTKAYFSCDSLFQSNSLSLKS